ncbi:MAG: cyclic nucleotide-binding domain-containing protein [Alphaproteobacteria bacterium]|nr:cyclic nucleotide-binding domain-containing protein [Alphaproteobacteria bacterium]
MSVDATLNYEAGAVLYRDGDAATHVYLVQSGAVQGVIGEKSLDFGSGQILGDGGIISGHYRMTVVAGPEGCTVLRMPIDDLTRELAQCPPLVKLLVSNLLGRQELTNSLLRRP